MRLILALLLAFSLLPALGVSDAAAQATCRAKCTETEQACLKRTGNKSQCGSAAQTCNSKCR